MPFLTCSVTQNWVPRLTLSIVNMGRIHNSREHVESAASGLRMDVHLVFLYREHIVQIIKRTSLKGLLLKYKSEQLVLNVPGP